MTGFHEQAWVTLAGACTFGMLVGFLGISQRLLVEWQSLTVEQARGAFTLVLLTLVPSALVAGLLADLWGGQEVVCLGSLIAATSVVLLLSKASYPRCLVAASGVAVGTAFVNCGTTVLMPRAFFDNHPAAATNLGFLFAGLGAVVTPLVIDLALRFQRTGYRRTLGLFALVCLAPVLAAVVTRSATDTGPAHPRFAVFHEPVVWVVGTAFALYGVLESWLATAALPYLKSAGVTPRKAGIWMAVTWLAFLGSRFVVAYSHQSELADTGALLTLGLCGLAVICVSFLNGSASRKNTAACILVLGASMGPLFSSLVGFLFLNVDPQEYGLAYGAAFAVGTAGSLLLAPLCKPRRGDEADKRSLRWLAAISLALLAVLLTAWVVW